jgi:hypothetical protein
VAVQRHLEAVVDVPVAVQAERLQRVLVGAVLLLEAHVLGAAEGFLQEDGGGDDGVVVEGHLVERTVEPVGLVVAPLERLVLGVQAVGGDGHVLGRAPLHRGLAVDPLALALREVVAAVVGDRHQGAAVGRRVGDLGRAAVADEAVGRVDEVGVGADVPVVRRGAAAGEVALLIAAEQGDAELLLASVQFSRPETSGVILAEVSSFSSMLVS